MTTPAAVGVGVAMAVVVTAAPMLAPSPASTSGATMASQTARVAHAQPRTTRAVVAATRTPGGTATVRLSVLGRAAGGGWRHLGTEVVGEPRGWFWHVLSGPAAVCHFALADTPRRQVDLRLLVSPSIGCDTVTRHFHVKSGDLVRG